MRFCQSAPRYYSTVLRMDPYLFLCMLGLIISVSNGQMGNQQMGQMGNRRNFPPRHNAGGGMGAGGANNGQVVSMNTGGMGTGTEAGMTGQGNTMPTPAGMGNNGGNFGNSMGQGAGEMGNGGFGGGMMGGGIDSSAFMGGGGNQWMRMNMAMNSELPPQMMMGGANFSPQNFMQYQACEKTPSNFNHICNPQAPNQCQTGTMISASMPMMGGMGGAGQQNMLVCSRMTEHGIARCCARNMQIATYLDKMFK